MKNASMTFRRKPFRRMRNIVEYDITSNATIRRNTSKDNSSNVNLSKIRRKFVENWSKNENSKMKVSYQKRNVHASEKMNKIE